MQTQKIYRLIDLVRRLDRNKNTLLRWEAEGKVPKARRDSRGWRYYTPEDFEFIVKLIREKYFNGEEHVTYFNSKETKFPVAVQNQKPFWKILLPFLAIASLLFWPLTNLQGASGVPAIISYQGRLSDSNGDLLGGSGTTYYFAFSIWDASSGGTKLWPSGNPATTTATVRQGVFSVNIGDTANSYPDPLNYDFNTNQDIFLQVQVSSNNSVFQTLTPRQRIGASAFARLASAVSGTSTPSSFGTTTPLTNTQVTVEATSTSAIPLAIRGALSQVADLFRIQNNAGANLFFVNSSGGLFASSTFQATGNSIFYGNLGIGTTTPSTALSLQGSALFSGDLTLANLTATGTTRFNGITYTWPSSQAALTCLQTDGAGTLSWATCGSGGTDGNWSFIGTDGGYIRLATSTNRVGIGTTTPYAKLSVESVGVATTTFALRPVASQSANIIDIYTSGGVLHTVMDSSNRFGIGTSTPSRPLSVQGSALLSGDLSLAGLTATGTLAVSGAGTSTFSGGLSLSSGNLNLASGGVFLINNTRVLDSTSLGTGITTASGLVTVSA
ncbi:MAG: MerR family transcriptional regulator, partial [bacterium]|nr:MerR family transcriptional regulator [bacterium]